jgi:glycosyltransferase involved in cell wall biosynthesis
MGLLWQRRMLAEARFIHFKTAGEMESAADVCGPAPATVVPNGIDWEAFQNLPAPQAAKQLIAGDRDARIVLFLGRIARIKRVDLLIRAFARTRAAKEECHLVVAGPDDEGLRPSLQALAAELGIGDRVRFVGMLDPQRRAAALAAADIWALPSHTENFGVAVLEALAAGCACLVSPHVKVATHAEKRGAVAISPLDATAWTREIDALLANNERREKLGAAGRTFARLYDWPLVAQKLRAMYELAITPSSA